MRPASASGTVASGHLACADVAAVPAFGYLGRNAPALRP
jgi:hypothetical protein